MFATILLLLHFLKGFFNGFNAEEFPTLLSVKKHSHFLL